MLVVSHRYFEDLRMMITGKCYTLLVTLDLGPKPRVIDLLRQLSKGHLLPGQFELTVRGSTIHVRRATQGLTSTEIFTAFRRGLIPTQGRVIPLRLNMRIGGREDDLASKVGVGLTSFLNGYVAGGVLGAIRGTTQELRPDWFSRCYRLLVDVDMGPSPRVIDFIEATRDLPLRYPCDNLYITYSNECIHLSYDNGEHNLPSEQIVNQLRDGEVPGYGVPYGPETKIGEHWMSSILYSMIGLIALPLIAVITNSTQYQVCKLVANGIPNGDDDLLFDDDGRCYIALADHPVGTTPLAIDWARSVPEEAIKYEKCILIGHPGMIHVLRHPRGRSPRVIISEMREGYALINGVVERLGPDSRIGKFETPCSMKVALTSAIISTLGWQLVRLTMGFVLAEPTLSTTRFIFGLLYSMVCAWSYFALLQGGNRKAKGTIYAMGSHGDQLGPNMIAEKSREIGLDVTMVNLTEGRLGRDILHAAERAEYDLILAQMGTAICEFVNHDETTFTPAFGKIVPGVITYSVNTAPNCRKTMKITSMDWLNRIIDPLWSKVDLQFESLPGHIPRTADGRNPILARSNRGTRSLLIALGSSSMKEPDGLDPSSTWSTRPTTKYQYECRTNHQEIFADYKTIMHHGGAGTDRTARACGCHSIRISDAIDRDLIDGINFVYHNDWQLWWVKAFESMDYAQKLAWYGVLSTKLEPRHHFRLQIEFWRAYTFTYVKMVVSSLTWLWSFVNAYYYAKSFSGTITILIFGSAMSSVSNCLMSASIRTMIRHLWSSITTAQLKHIITIVARMHCNSISTTTWVTPLFNLSPYGKLGKEILTYLFYKYQFILWEIVSYMAKFWLLVRLGFFSFSDEIKPGGIYLGIVRMENQTFGDMFKMRHVQFVNGETNCVVSLTMDDSLKVTVESKPYKASKMECNLLLPFMDMDDWEWLQSSLLKLNGTVYSPINNCQTSAFAILVRAGLNKFEIMEYDELACYLILLSAMFGLLVYSISLMATMGLIFLLFVTIGVFNERFSNLADDMMPHIHFAGAIFGTLELRPIRMLLQSIPDWLDGPLVIDKPSKYPAVPSFNCGVKPISLRVMSIPVKGKSRWFVQPCTGINRANYTLHRDYKATHNLHQVTDDGLATRMTKRQRDIVRDFRRRVASLELKGKIAVIATTKERPIQDEVMKAAMSCDGVILITNEDLSLTPDPKVHQIIVDATGRECAALRLACPGKKNTTWVSLNASYGMNVIKCVDKLLTVANADELVCVTNYGLNPGPAGLCAYKQSIVDSNTIDLDIYGSDEIAIANRRGTVYVERNLAMFTSLRKEMNFPCERRIVVFDENTLEDEMCFSVTQWNYEHIIPQLNNPDNWKLNVSRNDEGITVGDTTLTMSPVTSDMYSEGTPVEAIIDDIKVNMAGFAAKVGTTIERGLKNAKTSPITSAVASAYFRVAETFAFSHRDTPKRMWAPIHAELNKSRAEEIKLNLHSNPVFVPASFDETLSYYIKHLNFAQHDKKRILNPTEYRRRVNRNPYIDNYLAEKLPDAYNKGVDASVIATRQVMLESLARYNKGGFVDAMTDKDVTGITEALYKKNPDMFDNAVIADPYKLTKRFLSYKKYSAGLPFTYEGSGIKKRSDLRKFGWLKPIAELGKLPYKTGEWYPAIAHAFPKSQVVKLNKILENPAKMRSIVATAGFNNVQQGILNFDLNNRHDFTGTHEKVAMPLLGSYMNYVFQDLERFQNAYSFDVTAMDANLPDNVLKVIAELRKKGFENHPASDVINKHIDCAMEQTKFSYVMNLVASDIDELCGDDALTQRVREWAVGKGEWAISDKRVPGGVLCKRKGGSTGDSNVTFNNTKGLPIILMYVYCQATGTTYNSFFDRVALHNFGDDDVIAMDEGKDIADKMVSIAKDKLGLTLRYESTGTTVQDQVFLGKKPIPSELKEQDFILAGIPMPKYAIVNDTETMRMRLAREKAEMNRHKGIRHEMYRLEKAMGYALLTAHQPDMYNLIEEYFDEVWRRIPDSLVTQKWFKKKYKLPSYKEVIQKWYRPLRESDFQGVHGLQFQVSLVAKTEQSFIRICRALGMIMDWFPSHLVSPDQTANAYRVTELHAGYFEAHAWHNFVKKHGEAPTADELQSILNMGPYGQYTNAHYWLKTKGFDLPTSGPLFERNFAHATWMVLIYTGVYVQTNAMIGLVNKLPFGNVATELLNLHVYKCRRWFGTLSYLNYLATSTNNPIIDGLMPRDPYSYHKRAALLLQSLLPEAKMLGYIPIHKLMAAIGDSLSIFAWTANLSMSTAGDAGNTSNPDAWHKSLEEAKTIMAAGGTPLIVAHTGTGKTRDLPPLVMMDPDLKPSQTIIVMPRIIICESYAQKSGAVFKKRGISKKGRLMTCTYGYLNHSHANGAIWWDKDAVFVFDEAHEESTDWYQLRRTFLNNHRCITMTATPAAATCVDFQVVKVDIEPRYSITVETSPDMDTAITDYFPKCRRGLIIEPSLRKCSKIADNLRATGYAVKVVHAGDREIPDGVHIVATSVVESSITIPGCDLVIDSGERMVNDGGTLRRVPNDTAGMIQRKGRTGRTNSGLYVQLVAPKNVLYKPVPDVNSLLANSAAVSSLRMSIPFDRCSGSRSLLIDKYAIIDGVVPEYKDGISLLHFILNSGKTLDEAEPLYTKIARGRSVPELDHILMTDIIDINKLPNYSTVVKEYIRGRISYKIDGKSVGNIARILNYQVVTEMVDVEWEARADDRIEQGTRTPKNIVKTGRRRPCKSKRERG
uniref:Polyprotein n=1 Tax=Beihai hypo-like virus 1 TaxID=1922393 RepID=A0A1L3KFD0_9VIRU|nr:polyprotein [Beihai hypo-like virus 1]